MVKVFKQLKRETRGAILAYTAVIMPIFLGFIALGLDIAAWHIEKRMSQNIADAAAIAAAIERFKQANDEGVTTCGEGDPAYEAAADSALLNNYSTAAGHALQINCPALNGESAGAAGSTEAVVTIPLPVFLAALVNVTDEGKQASSYAIAAAGLGDSCIYALDPTSADTIIVRGGSSLTLTCGIRSNSTDPGSVDTAGTDSCIDATEIITAGGIEGSSCIGDDTATVEGAAETPDPLENMPPPEYDMDCNNGGLIANGNSPIDLRNGDTLTPGQYCNDVRLNDASATVTFLPGIHVFDGVALTITNGTANAEGVMFYFVNSDTSNSLDVSGGTLNMSAPTSGTYESIAIFVDQDDDTNYNITLTGGTGVNIDGIIYAKNQDIEYRGQAGSDSSIFIIAARIDLAGGSTITNTDAEGNPILFSEFLIRGTLVE